jgi:hypothetical protein
MRKISAFAASLVVAAFLTHVPSANAQDAALTLTGNMAPFSYLLGAPWSCTTNVPAMGGQPAHTDQGSASFVVAPGNVVHNHVATMTYSGDYYFSYSDRLSSYWQASADNMGVHAFLTSSDGKTYMGTSTMGRLAMQDTVTYSKVTPNKVTVHEVLTGSEPTATFDTVCTR